ncbi:RICIN domain-containing protein [Kitasatospora sp. NPDC051170]|uniref:RICIN domain-containing protein n=1 Tax=Kitasatospora sp. NPDC051170 TaxID=3364056 RepID=UPI003799AB7E
MSYYACNRTPIRRQSGPPILGATGRCLDAAWEAIDGNGTRAQIWDCYGVGQKNQLWRIS